jgi:CheY-like chemotaxis protein
LTWGLLAGAIAIAVIGGMVWRGRQQRLADAARQAEAAIAQARQDAQRAAQQAALHAERQAADQAAQQAALQAAQEAARQAAEQQAAAQAAARLQAEQTIRAQAEREAQQHARAEAERAAAAEAARQAHAQAQAEAQAREQAAVQAAERAAAQAAAAAAALAARPAPAPRSPAETLVMVADDSKVVRVKTSRLLAQHGYRVVLAEDGTQAAQLIENEVPAVLVTDVEMPGLDGFALTRHVRAHPRAARIPIIMITSADDRLKAAAAEAGVTLVLGKPYPEDELIACIERSQATATA